MLALSAALAACGGGSGDGTDAPGANQNANTELTDNGQSVNSLDTGNANATSGDQTPQTGASSPAAGIDPAPEQQASTGGSQPVQTKVNSVQTILDDMGLSNDARLKGIPDFAWAVHQNPGQLSMGADPRGCIAHSWWQNTSAVWPQYKDCDWWTGYVQWFVVFEGVGNAADNVRVESRNPQSWYLSRSTGQWTLIGEATNTGWFYATKTNVMWVPGTIDKYTGEGGSTVMRVERNHPYTYHGVWPQNTIDISAIASDIAAIYTTVEARLVVDNPALPDDRDQAMWLFQSGADYYPDVNAKAVNVYPPGVGLSRSKRITSEWQAFNFATTNNARKDYQGPDHGLTAQQLFDNPPPLR
ncbi:MAG: hypothetical protein AB8C46_14315 [Burkholderiaceae bacterium]